MANDGANSAQTGADSERLKDLVERTKADAGAPLEEETLIAIWELSQSDPAAFARLWDGLKTETRCQMKLLREQLDQIGKAMRQVRRAAGGRQPGEGTRVEITDFYAFMELHKYFYAPTRSLWPGASVDSQLAPIPVGPGGDTIPATEWIDRNQPVDQQTWHPGRPMIIKDMLVAEGALVRKKGGVVFNLYRPPTIEPGDASLAGPWLEHVRTVYPDDAEHILDWCADRVQHPDKKCNHALLLGGEQGIGKDSLLEPVRYAVGEWNYADIAPSELLGQFNRFAQNVILRINEAHDLGTDLSVFAFYERCKTLISAPPEAIFINEKHIPRYGIPNLVGVVITTNYLENGVYLPAEDRRHYVAQSKLPAAGKPGALDDAYFAKFHDWLENQGGKRHVAAFLRSRDLSGFNRKAPPPKTKAFWEIVDAQRATEETELADCIEQMRTNRRLRIGGDRDDDLIVFSMQELKATAEKLEMKNLQDWLADKKYRTQVPGKLKKLGYRRVNSSAEDHLWKIGKRRQAIYGLDKLPEQMLQDEALKLSRMQPFGGQ